MADWLNMLAGAPSGGAPGQRPLGYGKGKVYVSEPTYYGEPEPLPEDPALKADNATRMAAIQNLMGMQNPDLYTQPVPRTYAPEYNPEAPGQGWQPEGWNSATREPWKPSPEDRTVDMAGAAGPFINAGMSAMEPRSPGSKEGTLQRMGRGYDEGEANLEDVRKKKEKGSERYKHGKP